MHLKTDNVDYLKKPSRKFFFLHFFVIHSSSRHEKSCQISERLFSLFQCSRNQQCGASTELWMQCCPTYSNSKATQSYYRLPHSCLRHSAVLAHFLETNFEIVSDFRMGFSSVAQPIPIPKLRKVVTVYEL